jgi:hypothetical protein
MSIHLNDYKYWGNYTWWCIYISKFKKYWKLWNLLLFLLHFSVYFIKRTKPYECTPTWVKVFSILTDFSFLTKVQTVLEIRVNLMSFFFSVSEVRIFDKEIKKNWEDPDLFSPVDFCISLPFICEMSVC